MPTTFAIIHFLPYLAEAGGGGKGVPNSLCRPRPEIRSNFLTRLLWNIPCNLGWVPCMDVSFVYRFLQYEIGTQIAASCRTKTSAVPVGSSAEKIQRINAPKRIPKATESAVLQLSSHDAKISDTNVPASPRRRYCALRITSH